MTFKAERQKWINIGLCFVMIFICLGFCSANKSLFLAAICEALNLKRTMFSLSTSCRYIATSVTNIFFGYLILKAGIKKLISAGFVFLILSMLINSVANGVGMFMVGEIMAGIGYSFTGTAMVGSVVNRWSPENKGTIMGAVLCSNGVGGAIAAQILSPIIYSEKTAFGYRNAYRFLAVLLFVVLIVVLVLFKEKNGQTQQGAVAGGKKKKPRGQGWAGVDYSLVKKTPHFYMAVVCIFFTGFCLQGVVGIYAAHMRDVGLDAPFIATMSSITFMTLTASKFVAGISYDRIGLRKTITVSCLAAIGCMLALSFTSPTAAGKGLACAYAVMSAIAFPLETVMIPLYALDLYGEHSYDKILGIFVSANTAGYALGIPFSNIGYDLTGSYNSVLRVDAMIMLFVVLTMQWVITSTHRMREKCQ